MNAPGVPCHGLVNALIGVGPRHQKLHVQGAELGGPGGSAEDVRTAYDVHFSILIG